MPMHPKDKYRVSVRFANQTQNHDYTYKSTFPVADGDNVVVNSPYGGLTVVRVTKCKKNSKNDWEVTPATAWIVGVVNLKPFRQLVADDEMIAAKENLNEAHRRINKLRLEADKAGQNQKSTKKKKR